MTTLDKLCSNITNLQKRIVGDLKERDYISLVNEINNCLQIVLDLRDKKLFGEVGEEEIKQLSNLIVDLEEMFSLLEVIESNYSVESRMNYINLLDRTMTGIKRAKSLLKQWVSELSTNVVGVGLSSSTIGSKSLQSATSPIQKLTAVVDLEIEKFTVEQQRQIIKIIYKKTGLSEKNLEIIDILSGSVKIEFRIKNSNIENQVIEFNHKDFLCQIIISSSQIQETSESQKVKLLARFAKEMLVKLDRPTIKYSLMSIGIHPSRITDSDSNIEYFIAVLEYLEARKKTVEWIKKIEEEGVIFSDLKYSFFLDQDSNIIQETLTPKAEKMMSLYEMKSAQKCTDSNKNCNANSGNSLEKRS